MSDKLFLPVGRVSIVYLLQAPEHQAGLVKWGIFDAIESVKFPNWPL